MKNFLKSFERLFVYYFASMGISLLAIILLNIPMKFLLGDNYSDLTEFFISALSLVISLFILFYRDGFQNKKFDLKLFLFSELMLLVLLIVVIHFIGRAVYISGPTDCLARYILYKVNPTLINGKVMLNQYYMVLMICAYVFLYAPLILIAEYIGVKIRNKQFSKYKNNTKKN